MAYPAGAVQITGTIGTTSVLDTYATHQDYLGYGGLRAVADTAARDNITTTRRSFGMVVTTQDGSGSFILANVAMGGADNVLSNNANWIAYAPGGAGGLTVTSLTYTALQALISSAGLVQGSYYLINDYETIYDQPDYTAPLVASTTPATFTSTAEPLIVQAATVSSINSRAISTLYPDHVIEYDVNFTATEINGSPAKGRITLRIDERNNKTNYDSVAVLFKRYESSPGSGVYSIYWDNGNSSSNFKTFDDQSYNVTIGDFFTPYNATVVSPFILSNNVFFVQSYDIQTGNNFYNNTFVTQCSETIFGNENTFNLFNGICDKNRIGDAFQKNVIGDIFTNNVILSGCIDNVIGSGCISNQIGGFFTNNSIGINFKDNVIGVYFDSNGILSGFGNNFIGDYFNLNTVDANFQQNKIGLAFNNNIVGANFVSNVVLDNCGNNTFGLAASLNNLGYGFASNTLGNGFTDNNIGSGCASNVITTYFGYNDIGDYFLSNNIQTDFQSNVIGNNFFTNIIGESFKSNRIGNDFDYNTIGNNFGWNISGTPKDDGNDIGDMFQFNFIGNNFCSNVIGNDFTGNQINSSVRISYSGLSGTFSVGQTITNGTFIAYVVSDTGTYMNVRNMTGIFAAGQIIDNTPSGGTASATITSIVGSVVSDGDFNFNRIGAQFIGNYFGLNTLSNTFGKQVQNNTLDANTLSNTIGDYSNSNTIARNFQYNNIGAAFSSNSILLGFNNNRILNDFSSNIISFDFQQNSIGNGFSANEISNTFERNFITNAFSGNSIGRSFNNNNICDSFNSNTIGNFFQNNIFQTPTSLSYTAATFVYGAYNCIIFSNAGGTPTLSYYDATNTLIVIVTPNL